MLGSLHGSLPIDDTPVRSRSLKRATTIRTGWINKMLFAKQFQHLTVSLGSRIFCWPVQNIPQPRIKYWQWYFIYPSKLCCVAESWLHLGHARTLRHVVDVQWAELTFMTVLRCKTTVLKMIPEWKSSCKKCPAKLIWWQPKCIVSSRGSDPASCIHGHTSDACDVLLRNHWCDHGGDIACEWMAVSELSANQVLAARRQWPGPGHEKKSEIWRRSGEKHHCVPDLAIKQFTPHCV